MSPIAVTTTSSVDIRSAMNSAVAGYAAGITGVILGHPLDSLKVWVQTNSAGRNQHLSATTPSPSKASLLLPKPNTSSSPSGLARTPPVQALSGGASMSTLATQSAASTVTKTQHTYTQWLRTLRALYSGVSGPLVTVGIVQSISFSTYDAIRRVLHRRDCRQADAKDYLHNDSLQNVAVAGFVAGTSLAFLTSPLILVKTRQQVTGQGFRQAFREALLSPTTGRLNLSGCMVGIYPHLLSETVGRALYYTAYEACKRSIAQYKQSHGHTQVPTVNLWERMGAAAASGILCWAAIYPLDALRSRLYSQAGTPAHLPRLSTLEMAKVMYQERALYRGFSLTVLRAGPVAAAVLPIYDLVLDTLSQP